MMNGNSSAEVTSGNEKVYQLRRKNFQKRLVTNMSSLGYILIVLDYLKYGCSIWSLLIRVIVQIMLAAPFPNELHIRRLAGRNEIQTSRYFLSMGIPNNAAERSLPDQIPGGFPLTSTQEQPVHGESQIKKDLEEVKKKIRKAIFHGCLTLNVFYIIVAIIFPVDFIGKLEGNYPNDDGFVDTPSPFNNANGLVEGQRMGGFFMQMIGEFIPQSNLKGNLGVILFQFGILFCQYGLFILTCVNLADLGFEENLPDEIVNESKYSDGYDGKVFVMQIDPIEAINEVYPVSPPTISYDSNMV